MIVMMIAITPSLNASRRSFSTLRFSRRQPRLSRLLFRRQTLRHQITVHARRLTVEAGGHRVALLQIKAGRLDLHRRQRDAGTATAAPLLFRDPQQSAADAVAPQVFGQEEAVD